ncbi:MAG: hypothetical protein QOD53_1774 [Thermoleophilaceae bacterium]|nr:hypothetical protein [Thermoleophilaceae bacterium]
MSNTVTTSSNRRLLRGTCLALVLGGAVALGSTVSPRPYGFDSWPTPPAPARVQPLVQVRPVNPPRDADALVRRVQSSAPSAASHGTAHARPRPATAPDRSVVQPNRDRHTPVVPGHSSGATKPSRGRAHGHAGSGTPPTGQPDGHPQPQQQADPAPSPDPTAPVRVAQAAPAASLPPRADAKRGLAAGLSARAHGPSGQCPQAQRGDSGSEQDDSGSEQDD